MSGTGKPHVLIIGAGVTGLLIAQGLDKAGVRYTIFEAEEASTNRTKEWTMGVHWGVPLLERLLPQHLMARLGEASVDRSLDYVTPPTNGSRIYDGKTGGLLKELVSDGKLIRVSRRRLRELCSEGIEINFGHSLEELTCNSDETVTAVFANGAKFNGTIIVGADGPRSIIREFLFGPDKAAPVAMVDTVHLSTTVCYKDAEKSRFVRSAHPVWSLMIHPQIFIFISVQDVPDVEKPENWRFFVFVSWKGERDPELSNEGRLKLIKEKGANLAEPFRSAIQWLPHDTQIPYTDLRHWTGDSYDTHNGRVTLAGDAAHPMPPYRGQGLNHAIQDAHNLVHALAKIQMASELSSPNALIQAYSDEVSKRGADETLMSVNNGYMMLGYSQFKESPYMKHGLSRPQMAADNDRSSG